MEYCIADRIFDGMFSTFSATTDRKLNIERRLTEVEIVESVDLCMLVLEHDALSVSGLGCSRSP